MNPPREILQCADFPPVGLAYISAMLKENGIRTQTLDACAFSWKKLAKTIKDKNPLIVGIPCWTVERGQSFKLTKLVKKILPTTKIIIGGHHATAFPEHMFKLAYADAVAIGEGEITTVELAKAILNGGNPGEIRGIAYQQDEKVIITQPRDFIADLDVIPFPDYDDFDLDKYLGLPEVRARAAAVTTSRGCPYRCIFCSASKFWNRKWRARSAENVVDEIEWLYTDHKVRAFMFFDDNFTVSKERAIQICRRILERGLHISWVACSHVNQVDEELLGWMKEAGCYRIDYGVESGSPKVLRNIKKGQTTEQIEKAFRLTHKAGIKPRAYLMVGNPGEDEVTIEETVALMRKIKPLNARSGQILWVLPDTEIYELARSNGLISDEYWLRNDSMVYYTAEHNVEELVFLREKMMKGLAKNKGNLNAYAKYLIREVYYKYPILQKLRKWRGNGGF
ncbi:MAG: B12-binding domain-containing radical SAM protein [Candidatus Heimdallarchaeota archaeon]